MDLFFNYLPKTYGSTFTPGQSNTKVWPSITPSVPTATSSIYQSIIGIDLVASDSTYDIGFSIACSFTSTTSIQVVVTSLSTVNVKLNFIYVMVFIYSNAQLATVSPPAKYTLGFFSSTAANNAALLWNYAKVRPYNTFIGLTAFQMKGDNFFNYQTGVNSDVSALASSTNNWKKLSFCVNVFEFYYCPDATPYLMVATSICYDICPVRYCSNYSSFQCDACPYDCY
jgi:hypothetical protein